MRTLALVSSLLLASLEFSGCSSQQLYGAGQAWQKNECFKLADQQERGRCLGSTSTSYEQYKREAEDASSRKPAP